MMYVYMQETKIGLACMSLYVCMRLKHIHAGLVSFRSHVDHIVLVCLWLHVCLCSYIRAPSCKSIRDSYSAACFSGVNLDELHGLGSVVQDASRVPGGRSLDRIARRAGA